LTGRLASRYSATGQIKSPHFDRTYTAAHPTDV
jgi:hypothetical protein